MKNKKNKFNSDFENNDFQDEINGFDESFDTPFEETFDEKSSKGKELSKEEQKMIRATKRKGVDRSKLDPYDKSDLAEAKRYAKKNKGTVAFVVATIVLLIAVITTVAVVLIIKAQNGPSKADYEVCVGDEDPYTLNYGEANKYGQFYFDLKSIAKYAGLVVSGSDGIIKFTCEDGTWVRFENDKSIATVNGENVKVGGKAYVKSPTDKTPGECLVPFTFIEKLFSHKVNGKAVGMVFRVNKSNKVTVHRMSYGDTGENLPISFSADCFEYADTMLLSAENYPAVDQKTLLAISSPKLTLVNKTHPIDSEKITTDGLVSLTEFDCPIVDDLTEYDNKDFFDPIAALALVAMINEANKYLEGDDKILVSSAYRSFSYQKGLHERYIDNYMREHGVSAEEAEAQTLLLSAPAGKSEHHTGLCVDLVEQRSEHKELDESFEETAAFDWLSQNAHKYGFILRYPKDKTDITKYSYEPWHYRFVGIEAATIIYEDGITLEEFLVELK